MTTNLTKVSVTVIMILSATLLATVVLAKPETSHENRWENDIVDSDGEADIHPLFEDAGYHQAIHEDGIVHFTEGGSKGSMAGLSHMTIGANIVVNKQRPNDDTDRQMPDIAVDSQYNVHVVWRNCDVIDWCQAYYAKKLGNETAFRIEKKLTNLVNTRLAWVRIAVDASDRIFILWTDERFGGSGVDDILLVSSEDGGETFTPPKRITDDVTNDVFNVHIAIDSSERIHLAWMIHDMRFLFYYSKSTDHGLTFTDPVVANDNKTDIWFNDFDFDVDDSGNAHIIFADKREKEHCPIKMPDYACSNLYYLRTYDGGATFAPSFRVNDFNSSLAGQYDIALDGYDNPHIVWRDIREGDLDGDGKAENSDVYYTRSLDGGMSFEPNARVNSGGMNAEWYSIFVGASIDLDRDGSPHVTWMDGRNGDWDIYYSYSKDNGSSFVGDIRVSDDVRPASQVSDDIMLDDLGRPHIVWQDNRSFEEHIFNASEIWYAMGSPMPVLLAENKSYGQDHTNDVDERAQSDADTSVTTFLKVPPSVKSRIVPINERVSLRKAVRHL